ncbi:hypothetical protein FRB98_004088 [Tulasnella sp. 332]|nr:hypothetical protein FRB98_004088 [Tulasnella sp. 332]
MLRPSSPHGSKPSTEHRVSNSRPLRPTKPSKARASLEISDSADMPSRASSSEASVSARSPTPLPHLETAATSATAPGASTSTGRQAGKRKRSRVTPEQLAYLERVFAIDRSPGAAKRKELGELLGMGERQTQAKMLESRGRGAGHGGGIRGGSVSGGGSPMTPPELGMASDADLQALIHAGEPKTTSVHDLIAYTAEGSQVLTWYIFSEGFGFRMDVPYRCIETVDIRSRGAGVPLGYAVATITLTQSPNFYMEAATTTSTGAEGRMWKPCTDWTEAYQASTMLRHEVIGAAAQLYQALDRFPGHRSPSPPSGTILLSYPQPGLAYGLESGSGSGVGNDSGMYSDPSSSSRSPHQHGQLQSPSIDFIESPIDSTASQHFHYPPTHDQSTEDFLANATHVRQRSNSGPAAYHHAPQQHEPSLMSGSPLYPGSSYSPYEEHHQTASPPVDYLAMPAVGSTMPLPPSSQYPAASQHLENQFASSSYSALSDAMGVRQSLPPPIPPLSVTPPLQSAEPSSITYLHHPVPQAHTQVHQPPLAEYAQVPISRPSVTRSYSQPQELYEPIPQHPPPLAPQTATQELLTDYATYGTMMENQSTPALQPAFNSSLGGALGDYPIPPHPQRQKQRLASALDEGLQLF